MGETSFARMSFPQMAEHSIAFRLTVPFTFKGLSITLYDDYIIVAQGRAYAAISFSNQQNPVDSSTEEKYRGSPSAGLRDTG